jgi:hypothetical protein
MSKYKLLPFLLIPFIIFTSCAEEIVESTPSILDMQNQNKVTAKFSSIQEKVFNITCAVSGCHNGSTFPTLTAGNAYNNIVSVTGSSGQNLIEPGDADNSYLFLKITGAPGIFGVRMPNGREPLQQSVIDSIRVWINNGAMNN